MSDYDWFSAKPKRPAPAHGIKVKKIGATWWGQRWIESLERLSREFVTRLGRGRTYARSGRVHDLKVSPGCVTASVTGSDDEPYDVEIKLPVIDTRGWDRAIGSMAQTALFSAELLAGRMPANIDEAFRGAGHSLFPRKQHELETDCSCPDWASPCKHVAAVHYVLSEAFDRDPFLLFELRGRDKEQVLSKLAQLRCGSSEEKQTTPSASIPTVSLIGRIAADYDQPQATIPRLTFSFETPTVSASVLRQLGPLGPWTMDRDPADAFALVYDAASELAREMALGVSDAPEPEIAPKNAEVKAKKRRAARDRAS